MTYHIIEWVLTPLGEKPKEIGVYASKKEADHAMYEYCKERHYHCYCEIVEKDEGEEEI